MFYYEIRYFWCKIRRLFITKEKFIMFSRKDIIVLGMMIFALFLGAGNIIFPPMEGYTAGQHWATAALGFVVTGVLMPYHLSDCVCFRTWRRTHS